MPEARQLFEEALALSERGGDRLLDEVHALEAGEPIGLGRLLARPTATLSLEAQQRRIEHEAHAAGAIVDQRERRNRARSHAEHTHQQIGLAEGQALGADAHVQGLEVDAPIGLSVLEIAHRNDIDLEGACEGSLACSTCHVIIDPEWYEALPDATEDEEDMLDLAFGLTRTSRLGCQIISTEELDGLTVSLPAGTRVRGVYEWKLSEKSKKANAALTGLGHTRRIILADTLLEKYSADEIEAILAHELG
mgnify:CR=1 FL=1